MDDTDALEMRCMEIFGGNSTIHHRFDMPGLDACLFSRAQGGGRGGDLHYLSACGRGEIVRLLVADVAGHGARVADVADGFRRLVARNINRLDQSRMVRRLNKALVGDTSGGRFVTSVFATWHRPSGHLVVCNAGHQRPLLWRARTAEWELLDYRFDDAAEGLLNIPLGIIHPTDYYQFAVRLFPGDLVLLYTDGICDFGPHSGLNGEQRLLEVVQGIAPDSPAALVDALLASLAGEAERVTGIDDETMLAFSPSTRAFEGLSMRERLAMLGNIAGIVPVTERAVPG